MQPLVDGPRSGLTEAEVEESLAFGSGAQISWGVEVLDLDTGLAQDHDLEFISGSVGWSYRVPSSVTGRADLEATVRRTAELTVTGDWGEASPLHSLFRIFVTMASGNSPAVKWYLGTFVSSLPPASYDGQINRWTLELADKSHYWNLRQINDPVTIPFNKHILLFVQEELNEVFGETTFDFPDIDRFAQEDLFVEASDSYLTMFNVALEHQGFEPLTATPEGEAKTRDADAFFDIDIEHTYTTDDASTVVEGLDTDPVLAEAPNVLKFVAARGPSLPVKGNGIYYVYNYDVGAASINERGYEVEHRVEVEATDQAILSKIARRDANAYFMGGGTRVQLSVGLNPRHDDRDIIGIVYPEGGLTDANAKWAVTSWEVTLPEVIGSPEDVTMNLEAELLWTPNNNIVQTLPSITQSASGTFT